MSSNAIGGTPITGAALKDSLRDGRRVFLNGDQVEDVTTHPAFAGTIATVAEMYDAVQDPKSREQLAVQTPAGWTHRYFRTTDSVEELRSQRDAITAWARMSRGWLTRPPDYKAAFLGTLEANADYYGPFKDHARYWYELGQSMPYLNHAFVDPPGASKGRGSVRIEHTDAQGIRISGAKIVATSAALTHYNLIAPAAPVTEPERALVALVATNAPGVNLISRTPHAHLEDPHRWSNYPLSSRYDENDSLLVFDDVFVPWSDVLVAQDVWRANSFTSLSGFHERVMLHTATRQAVKLEFILGLLTEAYSAKGKRDDRAAQTKLGEVVVWKDLFWSLSESMCATATPWVSDTVLPSTRQAALVRPLLQVAYPRIRDIVMQDFGSGLIAVGGGVGDRLQPYVADLMNQNGLPSQDSVQLMRTLWDAFGSEYGGRSELFERNFGGSRDQVLSEAYRSHQALGLVEEAQDVVTSFLQNNCAEGQQSPAA